MIEIKVNQEKLRKVFNEMDNIPRNTIRPDYAHLIMGIFGGMWFDIEKPLLAYGLLKPINELSREGDEMPYYLVAQNNPAKGNHSNLSWGVARVNDNGSIFESFCGETIFQLDNRKSELYDEDREDEMMMIWVPECIVNPTTNFLAKNALESL